MRPYIRSVRNHRRDVKLFLLYSLASNVGIGVFMLLFNLYLVELGYREDYIGRFNAVNTLAMAVVALSIGWLINRFGIWRSVTAGLMLFLITSVLASFITDPLLLLGMGALSGAGNAFLFVPTMPFIVDLTEREERHGVAALAFSLNSLSMTVGSLIGGWMPRMLGAVFGLATPSPEAFRYTLVAGLLLAALALIPLFAMTAERKRSRPGDREPVQASADGTVLESRVVRRHMAVFVAVGGLMSFGAGALFPFYNVFLQTQGATAGQIGLIFSAAGLMAAAVGLASPYVSRRLGALVAVVVVRLTPVPFYLLLMIAPSLPVAIVAHMLRTTSINMAWPIDSTYISEILPGRASASVFSFRSAAWNLGWSISAYFAGSLIVDFGYNVAFGSYIVFMSAAMGLYYAYFIRAGRSRSALGHEAAPAVT